MELGASFAFVGRQVHLTVGDDDFYLDLPFYHLKLRCFVVVDLKMKKFTPADAGQRVTCATRATTCSLSSMLDGCEV